MRFRESLEFAVDFSHGDSTVSATQFRSPLPQQRVMVVDRSRSGGDVINHVTALDVVEGPTPLLTASKLVFRRVSEHQSTIAYARLCACPVEGRLSWQREGAGEGIRVVEADQDKSLMGSWRNNTRAIAY